MSKFIGLEPEVLKTREAAQFLGVSRSSLEHSRLSGELCGVPGPSFYKMGVSVRYKLSDLRDWLKKREVYKSATEEAVSKNNSKAL